MLVSHPGGDLNRAVWIDLSEPTEDELSHVSAATGLRIPNQNEISEIESSSRLACEAGAYRVSSPVVAARADGTHVLTPVGFVLTGRVLLTIRFGPAQTIEAAHEGADLLKTAQDAFLRILEIVVDRSADKLERAGAECDELSRGTFRENDRALVPSNLRSVLARVGRVADDTSRIRDSLLGLGRVAAYVQESGFEGAPQVNPPRLKAVRADVASLGDYEAHLSAKLQFLLDATLGFINIEQNEIVKILTIASVVGIPPVLVAGIYGMNFHRMPELSWSFGYPMAVGIIVASALLPLVWFKRRKWL